MDELFLRVLNRLSSSAAFEPPKQHRSHPAFRILTRHGKKQSVLPTHVPGCPCRHVSTARARPPAKLSESVRQVCPAPKLRLTNGQGWAPLVECVAGPLRPRCCRCPCAAPPTSMETALRRPFACLHVDVHLDSAGHSTRVPVPSVRASFPVIRLHYAPARGRIFFVLLQEKLARLRPKHGNASCSPREIFCMPKKARLVRFARPAGIPGAGGSIPARRTASAPPHGAKYELPSGYGAGPAQLVRIVHALRRTRHGALEVVLAGLALGLLSEAATHLAQATLC